MDKLESGDGYPNDIAINNIEKILQATRILTYYNVRITFSTKEVGWGVAIPNKGYRSLETGKLDAIKGNDGSRSEERLMDENSIPIKEGIDTFETKCLRLYSTFGADNSLKNLIDLLPWQHKQLKQEIENEQWQPTLYGLWFLKKPRDILR